MMNSIVRYKIKSKIVKGIKKDNTISYDLEKDKNIKIYFKQSCKSLTRNLEIENNWIFNFECDIERSIYNLSKSNAVGNDNIPAKVFNQDKNTPLIFKIKGKFDSWI